GVVVTDTNGDGTGDAIVTLPGGQSVTLADISRRQVDCPAKLSATKIRWFTRAAPLDTRDGPTPAERLRIGDLARTSDGAAEPLRWVGLRLPSEAEIEATANLRPAPIRQGALGLGLPLRDLAAYPQRPCVRARAHRPAGVRPKTGAGPRQKADQMRRDQGHRRHLPG
ncbi:MAG: hypothetical protein ACJA1L_002003, partial [Paracoccaceae bacterium]